MDIKYRVADIFDVPSITIMWQKIYTEGAYKDSIKIDQDDVRAFYITLTNRLFSNQYITIVAEDDKRLVGFCHGGIQERLFGKPLLFAYVDFIFVDKRYRKKDVTRGLINYFVKWCKKNKIKRVEFTGEINSKLKRFWSIFYSARPCAIIYKADI